MLTLKLEGRNHNTQSQACYNHSFRPHMWTGITTEKWGRNERGFLAVVHVRMIQHRCREASSPQGLQRVICAIGFKREQGRSGRAWSLFQNERQSPEVREPSFACKTRRFPILEPAPHRLECVIMLSGHLLGAEKTAVCPPAWALGRKLITSQSA